MKKENCGHFVSKISIQETVLYPLFEELFDFPQNAGATKADYFNFNDKG